MNTTREMPIPTTLEEALSMLQERDQIIAEQGLKITELKAQLARRFGQKTEKLTDEQCTLFQHLLDGEAEKSRREAEKTAQETMTEVRGHRRRNGRSMIPDHLPRVVERIELPEKDRACPGCGEQRVEIGTDSTEVLDIIPAQVRVIQYHRVKYACIDCCGEVVRAPEPPLPFDRSKASAGMVAHVAVSKFADHIPLYRQEGILKRSGVEFPRSTSCDWLTKTSETLEPLVKLLTRRILQSHCVQTDDTPVRLRDGPGRGSREARFWISVGDQEHPYVNFQFTRDRRGEHPQRWFGNYGGFIQCDAFAGYDPIFKLGHATEVGCWAHARRKFFDARTMDPDRGLSMLEQIRKLYAIESEAKELSPEDRLAIRQERSIAILDAIFSQLEAWATKVLPKSSIGKAVMYAIRLESALRRFTEDGRLEIDNNRCERALRGVAIGRKNWLFAGSEYGGQAAAAFFSIIGSARIHEIEPWAYLRDILTRMPRARHSELETFLPDIWKQSHPEAHLALNR